MSALENLLKASGFKGLAEFNRLVAGMPFSSPAQICRFKAWQLRDGSKEGLLELLGRKEKEEK